jgi:hypothetical protein
MNNTANSFPSSLRSFVDASTWTYAKTMPKWPHEYIIKDRVDPELFVQLVRHIREHGYEGRFYKRSITYFDEDGMTYWTMGDPIEVEDIINRCKKENTFEERERRGELPE